MPPRVRKVSTANRRPKGPSRTTRVDPSIPPEAIAAGNPKCWKGDCGRPAVEYKHHQWWCARHTPADQTYGCTHQIVSPCWGKLLCSFCGEFVKEEL